MQSTDRHGRCHFCQAFVGYSSHQDLWYWTFYPYNLGKEVGYFGWLGNRRSLRYHSLGVQLTSDVTDWERLRVRTVNGTARSADFSGSCDEAA